MLPNGLTSHHSLLLNGAERPPRLRQNWANARNRPGSRGPSNHAASRTVPSRVPRPPAGPRQGVLVAPNWGAQKRAVIIIRGALARATPWEIQQFFSNYGNVAYVELDEPTRNGIRSAKIRFEPPPSDMSFFQQGFCWITIGGFELKTLVEIPRQSPEDDTLKTPLGNECPSSLLFYPMKLAFGVLTGPSTFMRQKEVQGLGHGFELKFAADFRRRKLIIHFPLRFGHRGHQRQHYRLDIKFSIVRNIYRINTGNEHSALVIVLHDPPVVRKKMADASAEAWADRLAWEEEELWHRCVGIWEDSEAALAKPLSNDEGYHIIDIGRWTTYWVDLDKPGEERWSTIEAQLRDWNIKTEILNDFAQVPGKRAELWSMLAEPQEAGACLSGNGDLALLSQMAPISLPFDVRYQLEVCISRGILCEYNIDREFLEKLLELSEPGSQDPGRARLILEYAADQGMRIYEPMELFNDRAALTYHPTTLHIPDYCALVRKVIVTPTRTYFSTPTVETSNRIIRRYKHVQDHFIRVQFTDELHEGRIRASETVRDDEVYARVYQAMRRGIRMGRWQWKLLAYGNSQIRENGAFFFCQPEGNQENTVTCDSIRKEMGSFNHITSIAKLAARLGQCFSTTRLLKHISSPRIVKIPDVEKGRFCFTDGVGKISPVLARLVSEDWGLQAASPSAYQFRMGGCKGVLVTWPEAKGIEVHVRPSQEKFHAEYNGLEIIRCSQFSCATLNRQTILILSCLGVPDCVFTEMTREQLASYNAAMTDKQKAVERLSCYSDENMTTTTIATMILNGFMDSQEPFVRTVLQLWRSWSIKALREKARLIVEQGAFVLGCVDETGTLRGHSKATEGRKKIPQDQLPQIFLQVPDPKDRGAYKVITGVCIVGRNPSLHPGDIRVVEAVDVPKLRHLRDVVVFPLIGDRDVPSMCSGGDLDGDDFFVIWDPRLIPPEWGHPPMDYSAPKPPIQPRAEVAHSLGSFFVMYMKNDKLPLIAHAHLATADREVEGAKHRKCLRLAELHSTAVDYVKTGVPAEWNRKLNPRQYPHFMEKAPSRSYHSTCVLGQLYDMVDKDVFDSRDNYKLPFDQRILKRYQLDNSLLKEARKIKTQYDIAIRRVMGQLEIRTEFEIWTSFVLSKPRVGTDYKVQEKVGREAAGLKKQFRDICIKAAGERDFEKLGPFIAAMYRVTWEEICIALYEARQPHVLPDGTVGLRRITPRSMPLISFPWLFPDELGRIAAGSARQPRLRDVGLEPATIRPQPIRSRGGVGLETERDLAAMDYTRTSDGQFIHRGEILHLFRHDDDENGVGFNWSDVSADSGAEAASDAEQEQQSPVETSSSEEGSGEHPAMKVDAPRGSTVMASSRGIPSNVQEVSSRQPDGGGLVGGNGTVPTPDLLTSSPTLVGRVAPGIDGEMNVGTDLAAGQEQQVTAESGPRHSPGATADSGPRNGQRATESFTGRTEAGKPDSESFASNSEESWVQLDRSSSEVSATESAPLEIVSLPTGETISLNGDSNSLESSGRTTPNSGSSGGAMESRTDLAASSDASADEGQDNTSDSEVEYEEEVVVVEAETALERAARLA
ncbi:hypothetical protein VTK56DRAFT_2648 [Thermocarpiscus australiensis]